MRKQREREIQQQIDEKIKRMDELDKQREKEFKKNIKKY